MDSNLKLISFPAEIENVLSQKAEERGASLDMLKAVYRRGANATIQNHNELGMARVDAFVRLLRAGKPANSSYVQDNDLLPTSHPLSMRILTASAYDKELTVELRDLSEYESTELAIIALAEFSGLGYDIIPALRASWLRGVKENENPYSRAKSLAEYTYNSKDADLLPPNQKGASS